MSVCVQMYISSALCVYCHIDACTGLSFVLVHNYANVIMYVECVRHTCCTALLDKVLCTSGVPVLHAKHIGQPCVVFIVLQSV